MANGRVPEADFRDLLSSRSRAQGNGRPHEMDYLVQLVVKNKASEQVICGLHVPLNLRAIAWKLN